MQQMKGVSISQGLAVGKIVVLTSAAAPEAQAGTPEEELARFQRAQQQAVRDLGALYEKARAELGEAEAEIFSVHQLMAEDEDFADLITAAIAGGAEASQAVRQAGEQCAAMFSSMDDAYMRERAADVQDVAARIRRILRGEAETTLTGPCLIAAEELTPSQTVQFPRAFVQGFLTARGAANSHTGILARTLGVPAVSQLPVDAQLQGRTAILNGDEGTLILDPDEDQLRAAEAGIRARQAQREALQQLAKLPSVTKDGHAIRLYANLAGTDDLPLLQQSGAEGVGLLRSEFLYLGRCSYPTEDELFASYRQLVQAMDGRAVRDRGQPGYCRLTGEVYEVTLGRLAELLQGFRSSRETLTVAIFGDKQKTSALIGLLEDFGILEIAKTGTIAIERGRSTIYDDNKLKEEYNYGKNVL